MRYFYGLLCAIAAFFAFATPSQGQNTCNAPLLITLPYSSGNRTTCGTGNDYTAGAYCNATYGNGEDFVFRIDITGAPIAWQFNLGGTSNFKIVSVHSGCPPTPANCLGSIITGSGTTASGVIGFPTNGTYYVIVDHLPAPTCGFFTLDIVAPPSGPANDLCTNAVELFPTATTTCSQTVNGTTVNATSFNVAAPCTGTADDDVWYSFVATASYHTITVAGGAGFDAVVNLREGTCSPGTTNLACRDATGVAETENLAYTGFTIGKRYYVRVYGFGSNSGQGAFTICVSTPDQPPANDNCSGPNGTPPVLTPAANCANRVSTSSRYATQSSTNCNGTTTDDDVWFRFTASAAYQLVRFENVTPFSGTVGSMGLELYSTCNGSGSACNNNIPLTAGAGEAILHSLTPGNTYFLRVWTNGTNTGAGFDVCLIDPTPSNDNCANAAVVAIPSTGTVGNSNYANLSFPAEACGNSTAGTADDDVWFRFVSPSTPSSVTITATPSGTDPIQDIVINVYAGTTCPIAVGLTACADGGSSGSESVTFNAPVGNTTYYFRVYSWNSTNNPLSNANGSFTLALNQGALPLELTAFNGEPIGAVNRFVWETRSERQVQWHVLERSPDGGDWAEIGRKPGQANSLAPTQYQMDDPRPLPVAFYRLRSIDFDGSEQYSPIVRVVRPSEGFRLAAAYPSPTEGRIWVQLQTPVESPLKLRLTDATGQVVLEQSAEGENGVTTVNLSLTDLPGGVYTLVAFDGRVWSNAVRVVKR